MTKRQRGLERRLGFEGRRINIQHRQIAELVGSVTRALEAHEADAAVRMLAQLDAGMRAHFDLEERMHFPALHGANASLEPQLLRLVADHRSFETELAGIQRVVAGGALDVGGFKFSAWVDRVVEHEALEESLYPGEGPEARPPAKT